MTPGNLRSTTGSISEDIGDSTQNPSVANGKRKGPSVIVDPGLPMSGTPAGELVGTEVLGYCECPPRMDNPNSLETIKAPGIAVLNRAAPSNLLAKKERIDHLAGLVTLSALLVTAIQFCLTFSPGTINPEANVHYESEIWARLTINSYLLNLIWFGKL